MSKIISFKKSIWKYICCEWIWHSESTLDEWFLLPWLQSYNIGIEDLEQPLLVTQVKDRGEKKMALLIPELCYMTGE